jgi:hypothetical protein
MYLVVINDNTFRILSCTVCGNKTGMEAAETFMTEALREKRRFVKYLRFTTRSSHFWDFTQGRRSHIQRPWSAWPLKMGQIGCTQTTNLRCVKFQNSEVLVYPWTLNTKLNV